MLEGFARQGIAARWTPVVSSRELKARPLQVWLAGERLVLFRDGRGGVGALADRCPHRGVALSLGKVGRDGCLECPFHGWRFNAAGACATVPWNDVPEERRKRLGATSLAARERAGLIWVFAQEGIETTTELPVPPLLERAGLASWRHGETWECHWTRAMENMLDSPHLAFVHRRTIGRGMVRAARSGALMEVHVEQEPDWMRARWSIDGQLAGGALEWRSPNGMALLLPIPGQTAAIHVWCVPEQEHHTRMMIVSVRSFARYTGLGRLFDQLNRVILREDRAIVSSSSPAEVPPPSEEHSVASDRATLAFRRWYLDHRGTVTSVAASGSAPAGDSVEPMSAESNLASGET